MTGTTQRQLIFEVERIQIVRRRVATHPGYCPECSAFTDFVVVDALARTFEIPVAEAIRQLRDRRVHMQHPLDGSMVVCAESFLDRSAGSNRILTKSLRPASCDPYLTVSSE